MSAATTAPGESRRLAWRLRTLPRTWIYGRDVRIAASMPSRMLGLALLRPERSGGGLLLQGCRAIHTLGMRYSLDVRFLDGDGHELRRVLLPPGRFAAEPRASAVLEMPVTEGDRAA